MPAEPPLTFISYSRDDSDFALRLAADLKKAGAAVWMDQLDLVPSEEWDVAIEKALRRSPRMLLLLSPSSVESPAVRNEIAFALHAKKPIVPVFYKECELPMQLLRIQYIDFRREYERSFERLLKALGMQPAQPASSVAQTSEFDALYLSGPPGARALREKQQAEDARQARAIYEQIAADAERNKNERERIAADFQKTIFQATAAARVPGENACPTVSRGMPLTLGPIEAPGNAGAQAHTTARPSRLRAVRTLTGHSSEISGLAMTPDGKLAVSASADKTLKVWDLAGGRELLTLRGHDGAVNAVALLPDGQRAVSASDDKTLKVWELYYGTQVRTLHGHTSEVRLVTVTPDGQHVVSAAQSPADSTLRLWELATGRELRARSVQPHPVTALAALPDGRHIAWGDDNGSWDIWDLSSGRDLLSGRDPATVYEHGDAIFGMAVTRDGRRAVSVSADGTVRWWDVASGRAAGSFEQSDILSSVALLWGERLAAFTSTEYMLGVVDLESGEKIAEFKAEKVMNCCAASPDGRTILAGDALGVIHCLELE